MVIFSWADETDANIQLNEAEPDTTALIHSYKKLAEIEIKNANYPLALQHLFKAEKLTKDQHENPADIYIKLGELYVLENDLQKAKEYLAQANKVSTALDRPFLFLLKAKINLAQEKLNQAYENTLKALVFIQEQSNKKGEMEVYELLSKIYYEKSSFKPALSCANKFLSKAIEQNLPHYQAKAYNVMALVYGRLNSIDSANYALEQSEAISKNSGLFEKVAAAETKYKLAEIQNKPEKALQYFKKYNSLQDSLLSTNRIREIAELEAIRESEKQKEINSLLVEKANLQETEIEQKELEKKIYLIGLIMFILLGILAVFSLYRSRVANKKLLKLTHDIKSSRDKIKKTSEKLKLTNRKLVKIQAALISQKDAAERASRAKDTFLSSVTHELRTPLTAILGLSDEMLSQSYDGQTRENLEIIKFSGENLLTLVNDILDYNKIQSGRIELEHVSFSLKEHFEKLIKAIKPKARQNKVQLVFEYDEALPEYFIADPVRMGQVINNFLSNAVKFTEDGKVFLIVEGIDARDSSCTIRVAVKDEGIGIPHNKLQVIFERFAQASADTTRKYGGTGLGLAISKRIVEMYGSTVKVESEEGKGSTFYFDIKLEKGEASQVDTSESVLEEVPSEINILAVEDNKINQKLIAKTFATLDIDIDIANNGAEALQMLIEGKKEYDVVLMDMHMPVMDGEEATKKIRQEGGYLAHVPIIGLSGSTVKEEHELRDIGLSAFMQKPFKRDELLKLVAQQIIQA